MADVEWPGAWPAHIAGAPHVDEVEALELGYILEANRRFFHPLGLHLVGQAWGRGLRLRLLDGRSHPEGLLYEADPDLALARLRKVAHVRGEWVERARVRLERFGFIVQPPVTLRDARLLYHICGPDARGETRYDA